MKTIKEKFAEILKLTKDLENQLSFPEDLLKSQFGDPVKQVDNLIKTTTSSKL